MTTSQITNSAIYTGGRLHRALSSAPVLFKRKKDNSPTCALLSDDQNKTLNHLFSLNAQAFNPSLDTPNLSLISSILNDPFSLQLDHLVFNVTVNKPAHSSRFCTYLVSVTRYCIWLCRNAVKFHDTNFDMRSLFYVICE